MNIDTLLHEEICDEFEKLHEMEVGSEKHKATLDGLTKLMDRAIEMEKHDKERKDQLEAQKIEQELNRARLKEDRIGRIVRDTLTAAGLILPVVVTIWGTKKSFEFEKEGTITTIMGRGFINKLLPKK